jgi:hypothetical protein
MPPFDAVITIGGQSFVDGVWRLLAPALERLTNPLPLTLPGFTNSQVRVTNIVPVFPGTIGGTGLEIALTMEVTAEAILQVVTETGGATIALGPQTFNLSSLTGNLGLPAQTGSVTNLVFTGSAVALGTGAGTLTLPAATGALSGVTGNGTIALPPSISVPGIPLPAVIPVPLDLTQALPMATTALVPIAVTGPTALTRQSLLFAALNPTVTPPAAISAGTITTLTGQLQAAVAQVVAQLGISGVIPQPTIVDATVQAMLAPVPGLIAAALEDALTLLLAETGRLLFPPPGAGASCDVLALPTAGEAQLIATPGNGFELQVGVSRVAGVGDIPAFPAAAPATEVRLMVGNTFLLSVLCCLVEKLPNFALPVAATTSTTDIVGGAHLACCNFTGVTAAFGPIALGGTAADGISVCVNGALGAPKTFSIVGSFAGTVPNVVPLLAGIFPTIAAITVRFTLPITVDLDDTAALANLRVFGAPPAATVTVAPTAGLFGLLIAFILLVLAAALLIAFAVGWLAAPVVVPIITFLPSLAAVIVLLLVFLACGAVNFVLRNAVRLLLSGASLLKSPVTVPPGLLEAFGRISPATVTIDDLEAVSVMHTPTSVWGLLPRIGIPKRRPPKDPGGKDPGQPQPQPQPGVGTVGPGVTPGTTGTTRRGAAKKTKPKK